MSEKQFTLHWVLDAEAFIFREREGHTDSSCQFKVRASRSCTESFEALKSQTTATRGRNLTIDARAAWAENLKISDWPSQKTICRLSFGVTGISLCSRTTIALSMLDRAWWSLSNSQLWKRNPKINSNPQEKKPRDSIVSILNGQNTNVGYDQNH